MEREGKGSVCGRDREAERVREREGRERHVQRERDIGQRYENKNRHRQSGRERRNRKYVVETQSAKKRGDS